MTMTETLDKIRAANPKLVLRSISFWNDDTVSASIEGMSDKWTCKKTVDELCAALAEIKVLTPEEIKAEKIAKLKTELAALETAEAKSEGGAV